VPAQTFDVWKTVLLQVDASGVNTNGVSIRWTARRASSVTGNMSPDLRHQVTVGIANANDPETVKAFPEISSILTLVEAQLGQIAKAQGKL